MIKRMLVPTDGSVLSECVLPLAETLARAQGAEVVFARIVELPRWVGVEPEGYTSADIYDELVAAIEEDARKGLDALATRFQQAGIQASTVSRQGSPSISLLDLEVEQSPDLVVMGSHGRTGLARFTLGSVADRLVREGTAPVLIARSFATEAVKLQRAVVPLDGSPVSEEALSVVEALAGKPLHSVSLVRAVAGAGEQSPATAYLDTVAQRLSASGLAVSTAVRVEDPATAIEATAASADFVIMATHGRGGIDRMRHGSVAERVARHLDVPVLLVRAGAGPGGQGNQTPAARAGA